MGEKVEKALGVITTALVAVIAVFALLIVVGKPFGIHAYTVLSGSMEPTYHTGSLIYVKETDAADLGPGDVITYMISKDATATHRIVSVVEGEDGQTRFETKGDANEHADASLVHPDNVIGTPVLQIPMLGYVVGYIQVPPGTYVAIAACAMVVFLMFLPDLFPARKEQEEEGDGFEGGDRRAQGAYGQAAGTGYAGASHACAPYAAAYPVSPHPVANAYARPGQPMPHCTPRPSSQMPAQHASRPIQPARAPRVQQMPQMAQAAHAQQAARMPQAARAHQANPAAMQGNRASYAAQQPMQGAPQRPGAQAPTQAPSAAHAVRPTNPNHTQACPPQAQPTRRPQAAHAAEGAVRRRTFS